MAANKEYRGKSSCIFGDGGETPSDFCQWNNRMFIKTCGTDGVDRVELCKLCQSQSLLRSVSFIGSLLNKKTD
jgi:hypothetical protein